MTELQKANHRIKELEEQVKKLSSNIPVSSSFANLCRECGKTIAKPREYCDEHYPYKIVSK